MKSRDTEFLYEIGTLRFIDRTWRQFLNKDFANLAEHMLRMTWIAMIIAKNEGADMEKVIKMALVHDIAESRTGDVHYLSNKYVDRHEDRALRDMLKDTSLEEEFLELMDEYEKRDSLESHVVKDADNIDVDFELMEQKTRGYGGAGFWKEDRSERIGKNLFTETGKKLWKELHDTNPHSWHKNGPHIFKENTEE